MKKLLLYILTILLFKSTLGQQCYMALYRYNVPNTFSKIKLNDSNLSKDDYNIKIKGTQDSVAYNNSTLNDSLIIAKAKELKKLINNNITYVAECCYDKKKFYNLDLINGTESTNQYYVPNANTTIAFKTDIFSYSYVDLKQFYKVFIYAQDKNDLENNIIDTSCYVIDTSKLHFMPTGRTSKINDWRCEEYELTITSPDYNYTVWISKQIPDYITPPIFGLDLNGGIVKIEFKNGNSITLKEYYKIDEISTLTPACDNDISAFPKTDILLHGLNAND